MIGRTERVPDKQQRLQNENKNGSVIVVGGSAAGLLTAAKVAAGGRDVRVLDAKSGLDPTPRSLIVTHHFREQLREVAASCIVNEIRRFELFTDGRSAEVALSRPDLIIERARLIPALANEAAKAGAKISFDSHFLGLGPNSRGLRLEVETAGKREELHADQVVGADGATTRVGRAAGWPPVETVPLVQAIVKLPKDCRPDTTRVWFVPDDTPYFYWLIPENESRGALGIIGEGSGQETKKRIERFLEKRNMQPLEWQGARIPVYRKWIPVERRVVTGFRGAQGVADKLLGSGRGGELRALRRELDTHWLIRKTLHHFQQKDYSYLVDLLNVATRESLGQIHRDHSTRLLWNVLRRQPRLVLLGLRGLLMGKKDR